MKIFKDDKDTVIDCEGKTLDECIKLLEDMFRPKETISVQCDDCSIIEFEKPEFECELFKSKGEFIFGIIKEDDDWYICEWMLDGRCNDTVAFFPVSEYNLKRIK